MPADPKVPARVLSPADVDTLLARLLDLVCHPGLIQCPLGLPKKTWMTRMTPGFLPAMPRRRSPKRILDGPVPDAQTAKGGQIRMPPRTAARMPMPRLHYLLLAPPTRPGDAWGCFSQKESRMVPLCQKESRMVPLYLCARQRRRFQGGTAPHLPYAGTSPEKNPEMVRSRGCHAPAISDRTMPCFRAFVRTTVSQQSGQTPWLNWVPILSAK
jgi:hypothetical protein